MWLRRLNQNDEGNETLPNARIDERSPVEGLRELASDLQFGVAQGEWGGFSSAQMSVERFHQERSGFVADTPKTADHVLCAGLQEGAREASDLVATGDLTAIGLAGAENDEA